VVGGVSGAGDSAAVDAAGRRQLRVARCRRVVVVVVWVVVGVGRRHVTGVRLRGTPHHRQELVRLPGQHHRHDHRYATLDNTCGVGDNVFVRIYAGCLVAVVCGVT